MFQRDTVDTSPDLGGQNVLKTFEMVINRRTTRTELERVFCRWICFHLPVRSWIFFWPSYGGRSHPPPPRDPPLSAGLRYVGLEARVQRDEKRRLVGHRQHSLLDPRALHVVVLNDHVLLEYFHRVQLVRALAFRQRHLANDQRHRHSLSRLAMETILKNSHHVLYPYLPEKKVSTLSS